MLSESTSNKILSLYKKYLNDISSFTKEDLKSLMILYSEHSLFNDMLSTKGYTVFKKILYNIRLKSYEKYDTVVKFDSNKNIFNLLLFGNIKKRNIFKGMRKEYSKKNSGKYLYCVYHCLSNCLFAEIDRHVYMKYLVSSASDLYDKFVGKISKYSFFDNLSNVQYETLFLNYDERKYGPHETIYEEGDDIDGVYLILKGKCLILKKRQINLSKDNNSNGLFYQNNYVTITNGNDIYNDIKQLKENNNSKEFHTLFAKNNKNNNALLTMSIGDIFGDLEINLNNNKREFSVKCENYNKTKVWFFSIDLIKNIVKNFKDLSEQKYDIIRTRFEYANIIEKIKKENPINKQELKIDEIMNNSKRIYSNFRPFQQKINICAFQPNFTEGNKKGQFPLKNNKLFLSSRNKTINRKTSIFNKNNSTSQPKIKLKILTNKSQNQKNLITIKLENNYIKKVNSNMFSVKEIEQPKICKLNNIKPIGPKIFMNRINKNRAQALFKSSNDVTF